MSLVSYVFLLLTLTVGLYLFGAYNCLLAFFEAFTCFACKEMDQIGPIFDYVIVGAGSAGSTLALRLSEDKSSSVLLLEAGSSGNELMNIPVVGPLLQKSFADWQYQTVPQKNACFALECKRSNWPTGKIVGGTGRLNNMIYLRGSSNDFLEWYSDDPNFDYNRDILAYFKRAERNKYSLDEKHHGKRGHLVVQNSTFTSRLATAFLEAIEYLGFHIRDLNGERPMGFMKPQVNLRFGARWTTAHYLLKRKRSNLILQTNSFVHKILLKENFEAYAVKYTYIGSDYYVRARRGIIVCAGVVGSPKLLMLSGIGPEKHLNDLKIKPRLNLPVGRNLQDHITTGLDLVILNQTLEVNVANLVNPFAAFDYFFYGSGPWTTTGCEIVGLLDSLSSFKSEDLFSDRNDGLLEKVIEHYKNCDDNAELTPDLELMLIPAGISDDFTQHLRKAMGINDKTWHNYFAPLKHETTISILPVVLHPKSKGFLLLEDKDFNSKPLINPQYLSSEEDLEVLIRGIFLIKLIIATEPMQKLGAKLYEKPLPGCEHIPFDTKLYWKCYVQHLTMTAYHPVGTCKMGSRNDPTTVINHNFQVHNTNKLYIVDGSIFPSLPSANINAAIVMMAEKAADVIKYHKHNHFCDRREIFLTKYVC